MPLQYHHTLQPPANIHDSNTCFLPRILHRYFDVFILWSPSSLVFLPQLISGLSQYPVFGLRIDVTDLFIRCIDSVFLGSQSIYHLTWVQEPQKFKWVGLKMSRLCSIQQCYSLNSLLCKDQKPNRTRNWESTGVKMYLNNGESIRVYEFSSDWWLW